MVPFGIIFCCQFVLLHRSLSATSIPLMLLDLRAAVRQVSVPSATPCPWDTHPSPSLLPSPLSNLLTLPYAQDLVLPINHGQLLPH